MTNDITKKSITEIFLDKAVALLKQKYLNKPIYLSTMDIHGVFEDFYIDFYTYTINGVFNNSIVINMDTLTEKDIEFDKIKIKNLAVGDVFSFLNSTERIKISKISDTHIELYYLRGCDYIEKIRESIEDTIIIKH